MMLISSLVRLTQVVRKSKANWKLIAPILPDSSTRKLTDWYLLHLMVTESMRQALLKHSKQAWEVYWSFSSEDIWAQLLNWKLDQKEPPMKSVFMQYFAVQSTAVFMFMFMSDHAKAQLALFEVQIAVRFVTKRFRKPVRTVVDQVAERVSGKTLPTHCRLVPWALRYGFILSVRTEFEGTMLSSSVQVRLSCTPLEMVTKLQGDQEQPQSQSYSSHMQKVESQLLVESTSEPPFFMDSNLSVTLEPYEHVLVADSLHELQQTAEVKETKAETSASSNRVRAIMILYQWWVGQ